MCASAVSPLTSSRGVCTHLPRRAQGATDIRCEPADGVLRGVRRLAGWLAGSAAPIRLACPPRRRLAVGSKAAQAPAHRGVSPRLFRRSRICAFAAFARGALAATSRGETIVAVPEPEPLSHSSAPRLVLTSASARSALDMLPGYLRAVISVCGRALSAITTGLRCSGSARGASGRRRNTTVRAAYLLA